MASIISIVPIVLLFVLMLGFKMAGHKSALLTLVVTVLLALLAASPLGMIAPKHAGDSIIALSGWAVVEGLLKVVFPILIIILMAIYSYNILVESKQIEVIKKQFTSITDDKGLLVLLLAWGFGGLLEGMAGFGTAVAIPAAILIGLGFKPMFSALVSLVGNTVATGFGAIGTFVTGSDTSSNILFAKLQAHVANQLGMTGTDTFFGVEGSQSNWLVAANTTGATGGKMISPQSIAIATASCDMEGKDGEILRSAIPYAVMYIVLGGLMVYFGC